MSNELTVENAIAVVDHALAGEADPVITAVRLINMAGVAFINAHSWGFMERPPTKLDAIQDQEYINLPSDYGEWVWAEMTNGVVQNFKKTSIEHLTSLRSRAFAWTGFRQYGAISRPAGTSSAGPGLLRLELFPTPTANVTDFLTLAYRASWTNKDSDQGYIDLPTFAHGAYLEFCRAYAKGWEEEDIATVSERLMLVKQGPVFEDAMRQDSSQERFIGPMTGGAASGTTEIVQNWDGTAVLPP